MNKYIGIFIVTGQIFCSAHANENDAVIDMLIAAKATGMCGTFKQLSAFQESTKMPGGDDFLVRFLNTEAARLGKTLPQFLKECQTAVEYYTTIMRALVLFQEFLLIPRFREAKVEHSEIACCGDVYLIAENGRNKEFLEQYARAGRRLYGRIAKA